MAGHAIEQLPLFIHVNPATKLEVRPWRGGRWLFVDNVAIGELTATPEGEAILIERDAQFRDDARRRSRRAG